MKNIIAIILLVIPISVVAQDYVMFSTVTLNPKPGMTGELIEGMSSHKAKFHKDDSPFQVTVFRINNGPNTGKLIWLEGPQTYSDFDAYDNLGKEHGPDWAKSIQTHCADMGVTEYWKQWSEYSRAATKNYPVYVANYLEVNIDGQQGFRIRGLFKKLGEAVKSMDGDFSWEIYSNELQQGKVGRHFAILTGYQSFSDLDKSINEFGERKFKDAFEKINGEGSYSIFRDEWRDVFIDSYDEILTVVNF